MEWFRLILFPSWKFDCGDLFSAAVSVDSSPGPRYRIDAKVTQFGRMETPSYCILGRGKLTNEGIKSEKVSHPSEWLPIGQIFYLSFAFTTPIIRKRQQPL